MQFSKKIYELMGKTLKLENQQNKKALLQLEHICGRKLTETWRISKMFKKNSHDSTDSKKCIQNICCYLSMRAHLFKEGGDLKLKGQASLVHWIEHPLLKI